MPHRVERPDTLEPNTIEIKNDSPAFGGNTPQTILMIVVLPAPLGPMQAVTFPSGIAIDTSSKTKTPPKFIASRSILRPLFPEVIFAHEAAPPKDH